jgi:DNA mismatch repair protein MutS2
LGDLVRLLSLPTPGKVIGLLGDDEIEVEVGRLRMRVRREEVQVLAGGSAGVLPQSFTSQVARSGGSIAGRQMSREGSGSRTGRTDPSIVRFDAESPESPAEINVIGKTAEAAREEVDKFLDNSYMAGRFRVRVIHGHGKGILKRSLHEMFASHAHVDKFYLASQQEGGGGATIVELRL